MAAAKQLISKYYPWSTEREREPGADFDRQQTSNNRFNTDWEEPDKLCWIEESALVICILSDWICEMLFLLKSIRSYEASVLLDLLLGIN